MTFGSTRFKSPVPSSTMVIVPTPSLISTSNARAGIADNETAKAKANVPKRVVIMICDPLLSRCTSSMA